jgi:hypothetical protein
VTMKILGYGLGGRGSIPGKVKSILFSAASRQGPKTTQCTILWIPGGKIYSGVKLTIRLHLVQRSRMVELHIHAPHMPSWRNA